MNNSHVTPSWQVSKLDCIFTADSLKEMCPLLRILKDNPSLFKAALLMKAVRMISYISLDGGILQAFRA